jgi:hypothetical protein
MVSGGKNNLNLAVLKKFKIFYWTNFDQLSVVEN